MSDTVDTETMKVSGAADALSSPKDNNIAPKCEVTDPTPSTKDEQGGNNKRDAQVKINFERVPFSPRLPPWNDKWLASKRRDGKMLNCYPIVSEQSKRLVSFKIKLNPDTATVWW